ncbi:amidohydrolase [Bacillus norwichensis]|uniref:Amidohydrolase n=1 Tax=Bacillus norwichensis TaxID=2762217 RepID=A0ABR8VLT5_9BACI|nr:amidohydrolase [Bacillus norwichensis]MBD8005546.1 amidohydrolase [Bacillus norwichensis]
MFADVIFYNADIYTMDDAHPTASRVAVKNGKIIAFDQDTEPLKGPSTKMVDIDRKTVLPGFIESHAHPIHYAANTLQLDLRTEIAPDIDSILNAVREKAKVTPKGEWIIGMGWDDSKLKEKRFPTINELNEAAPDHPVFLKRTCVHNAVANSMAFKVSGLPEIPTDPDGGHFHIDPKSGKPSGLIQENAMHEFSVPAFSIEQLKGAMMKAQEQFFRWGITTAHEMAATKNEMIVYQQLQKEEKFQLKARLWLWAIDLMGWTGVQEETLKLGIESHLGNDRLNIQGLKYMLDGSVGGRTAALAKPYEGDGDNDGILYMQQDHLNDLVSESIKHNLRVSIHGIGERAIEMALQAISNAATPEEIKNMRNRIEHCTLPTDEHLRKIAEYGIIAASSIGFIYSIGDSYLANLGQERAEKVFPHASFKSHGIIAPGNSDLPVCDGNPLFGIYSAVVRKTMSGQQLGTAEAISVEDAIKAYTIDAAYSGFDEDIIGSLSIGKYADLIVLDNDPFKVDPEFIKDIQVIQTIVEGNTVYSST